MLTLSPWITLKAGCWKTRYKFCLAFSPYWSDGSRVGWALEVISGHTPGREAGMLTDLEIPLWEQKWARHLPSSADCHFFLPGLWSSLSLEEQCFTLTSRALLPPLYSILQAYSALGVIRGDYISAIPHLQPQSSCHSCWYLLVTSL